MTDTATTTPKKTLTLEMTGYIMKGVSDITLWGGDKACIQMNSVRLRSLDKDNIKEHLNDGGFGVQSINGAIVDIYEDYEGTLQYKETLTIGEVSEGTWDYYNNEY